MDVKTVRDSLFQFIKEGKDDKARELFKTKDAEVKAEEAVLEAKKRLERLETLLSDIKKIGEYLDSDVTPPEDNVDTLLKSKGFKTETDHGVKGWFRRRTEILPKRKKGSDNSD